MSAGPAAGRGTTRRALLSGVGLAGLGAVAACGGSAQDPTSTASASETTTATATATASPAPTSTEPSSVPDGLVESQRTEYRFGDAARQVSDLWLPTGDRREGLVVLVHGGGYQAGTDRRDLNNHVSDLVGRGWPVLNADYRGVGDGGGWTGTFTDVGTAVDMAAEAAAQYSLPLDKVLVMGHSAGGHLAMWAAARRNLPAGAPGADPRVVPAFAGSMSGVLHPSALGTPEGDQNVVAVFGGTVTDVDQHYALGDPTRLVPLRIPVFAIHGTADDTVPPSQSQEFADAATAAGDTVTFQLFEGATHVDPLYVGEAMWGTARSWIESSLGG